MEGFPGGSVVKNPPAMQENQVRSLGREDSLEEMRALSGLLARETHGQRSLERATVLEVPKGQIPLSTSDIEATNHMCTWNFIEDLKYR